MTVFDQKIISNFKFYNFVIINIGLDLDPGPDWIRGQ